MSDADPELDRLQDLLATIPSEWKGMNAVELDGYVAALIVCPDTVPPSEWLPGVWGSNIGFEDAEGTEATIAAVMGHYSRIARELAESRRTMRRSWEWTPTAARPCGSRRSTASNEACGCVGACGGRLREATTGRRRRRST